MSKLIDSILRRIQDVRPRFRDAHDAVAFLIHTTLMQIGSLELVSLQAEGPEEDLGLCPPEWNASADTYTFRYKPHTSSTTSSSTSTSSTSSASASSDTSSFSSSSVPNDIPTYVVTMMRVDQLLVVYAAAHRSGSSSTDVAQLEIKVNDFVGDKVQGVSPLSLYRDPTICVERVQNSLVSGLHLSDSDSSKEASSKTSTTQATSQPAPPTVVTPPPAAPVPPRFDPLRDDRDDPLRIGPVRYPPNFPRPYGDFDSDMLPGPLPGRFGPGGNLMGPDDPRFGPLGGGHPSIGLPGRGRGRGRGGQPRFDPYAPFGMGDPDRDHMPPPGPSSWFG